MNRMATAKGAALGLLNESYTLRNQARALTPSLAACLTHHIESVTCYVHLTTLGLHQPVPGALAARRRG